ncbi:acyl--CoA ligase [Actinomadura harenae]|uniref:Acyl--CoA ligase n=1 Tax=Actinomadura harenae TaxID=2483351 RepID=A0A3M2M0H6_9ACTN|nr:acyl--CoA ligase [Actinomadura harenae]
MLAGPGVGDLLRRAARRFPDRPAIRSGTVELGYAELDRLADRCAAALARSLGTHGKVLALTLTLDHWFAVAFFGAIRSGNIPALVNPLLREEALANLVRACGAEAAIVAPGVRDRLPTLATIVTTDELGELIDGAEGPPPHLVPAPGDVACLQFTSGTTGAPKTVQLTHRNVTVNAAQTARAHRVTGDSVVFDNLPTFHLMHLTVATAAGARLVLWPGGDPAEAMAAAARHGATHFYSLPVRLGRLASDPRLPDLSVPTLTAVLSGGSPLPALTAETLGARFGVPVAQGYGLQETSPSTHFDDLDAPRPGSCGHPLAGTECRVVRLDDGQVAPAGALGEIQVRGPQVMKGYLGADEGAHLTADGWFATGDVGHLAQDGRLTLVDRIKDVFKHDNWLVAPSEIERVLRRHPDVADCLVVDYPDDLSGAVPYGLVVPEGEDPDPAELAAYVAARLPYYQHLHHLRFVADIPRSATGKPQRRELRDQARSRPSPVPPSPPSPSDAPGAANAGSR